jgi:ABC-2 type transport system permease protein
MTNTTAPHAAGRLPAAGKLLAAQIRYHARLLLAGGRSLVMGFGLPIILLLASDQTKGAHPNVAGDAVFGLTLIAWTGYGIRLVADREAGILKRWRATPLPRWCYFCGRVISSALVGVLAGAVTIAAAVLFYGTHFHAAPGEFLTATSALAMLLVLVLGAIAWAGAATALTAVIPTVDAATPILMLTYFPVIIISGVFGTLSEPQWLATLATYLPAQPLIDALTHAARHNPGNQILPAHDLIVLAAWAVGGLLVATRLFRWEPHRPTQRRAARPKRDQVLQFTGLGTANDVGPAREQGAWEVHH